MSTACIAISLRGHTYDVHCVLTVQNKCLDANGQALDLPVEMRPSDLTAARFALISRHVITCKPFLHHIKEVLAFEDFLTMSKYGD